MWTAFTYISTVIGFFSSIGTIVGLWFFFGNRLLYKPKLRIYGVSTSEHHEFPEGPMIIPTVSICVQNLLDRPVWIDQIVFLYDPGTAVVPLVEGEKPVHMRVQALGTHTDAINPRLSAIHVPGPIAVAGNTSTSMQQLKLLWIDENAMSMDCIIVVRAHLDDTAVPTPYSMFPPPVRVLRAPFILQR